MVPPAGEGEHPTPRSEYIEVIRTLLAENRGAPAKTSDIAARLGVSPPTVTEMVQKMAREGLVKHTPYRGAEFTEQGRMEAARVRRRTALLELLLVQRLGLGAEEARAGARRMEHALPDAVVDALCRFLGHPATALDGGAVEPGKCCPGRMKAEG